MATECNWADLAKKPTERTILDFEVYKKSFFGGMKRAMKYDGWCIGFNHHPDGEIDLKTILIQDGNFDIRPLNPDLVIGVLRAAEMRFAEQRDEKKAEVVKKAFMKLISAVVEFPSD